jgi:hypothetical protein
MTTWDLVEIWLWTSIATAWVIYIATIILTFAAYLALAWAILTAAERVIGRWKRRAVARRWLAELREPSEPAGPRIDTRPGTDRAALDICQDIENAGVANRRNTRKGETT